MVQFASFFIVLPLVLSGIDDQALASKNPPANRYYVCVPWAIQADPQSWDEVVGYYSDPLFVLPNELTLLPPLPPQANSSPANGVAATVPNDTPDTAARGPRKVKRQSQRD